MPTGSGQQSPLLVGVDVGGTFTDLVAFDPATGALTAVKVPSTPPAFERGVLDAIGRLSEPAVVPVAAVVHGSTVATNALLERAGEPVAFVTTAGFRDLLLIGRQNRPDLYALRVRRPEPITPQRNWFTVAERTAADGSIVDPLTDAEVARVVAAVTGQGLRHAAVCLLFSFVNADHERRIGAALEAAGVTVTLSSDVLPEFREYERASTTAINASLSPVVAAYLGRLVVGLERLGERSNAQRSTSNRGPAAVDGGTLNVGGLAFAPPPLAIMHSGGGTLSPELAARQAAKLVLSGPAGGVIGAAFVAAAAGFADVITYDMGGTSTDVAVVTGGKPQWTTGGVVDGLPIGLAAFDIHTVGAGGGSIAVIDAGGALRVGPTSAGATPGPACYGRGGTEPTVTDANAVLGRLPAGGPLAIDVSRATAALRPLADRMSRSVAEAALGVVRVAEANMTAAVRAVTSRRGHDPRRFALVSFGGAGGLHACAVAAALGVTRVVVPPHCGVLSALGMVVAPPTVDVSRTIVHLPTDDATLAAAFDALDRSAADQLPAGRAERFADVRFAGQSYELTVPVTAATTTAGVGEAFRAAYATAYGSCPPGRAVQVVTVRVRRTGPAAAVTLPAVAADPAGRRTASLVDAAGRPASAALLTRGGLQSAGPTAGPLLLVDPTATAYVPAGWSATARADGTVVAEKGNRATGHVPLTRHGA